MLDMLSETVRRVPVFGCQRTQPALSLVADPGRGVTGKMPVEECKGRPVPALIREAIGRRVSARYFCEQFPDSPPRLGAHRLGINGLCIASRQHEAEGMDFTRK